ncbi:MAG: hypothetical protein H7Z21_05450 [Hymenobacter sp.]|nr:hypothetical protein [Hymenobacter sp.]
MPTLPSPKPAPDLSAIQAEERPTQREALQTAEQEKDWFEEDKRRGKHRRDQQARNLLHWLLLLLLMAAGLILLVALVIRACHVFLPPAQFWLSKEQLGFIDHLFQLAGSGFLGGLMTKYLTRNLEE